MRIKVLYFVIITSSFVFASEPPIDPTPEIGKLALEQCREHQWELGSELLERMTALASTLMIKDESFVGYAIAIKNDLDLREDGKKHAKRARSKSLSS